MIVSQVVALRKESVDRNRNGLRLLLVLLLSLSARRAWIEIVTANVDGFYWWGRSPQGERG